MTIISQCPAFCRKPPTVAHAAALVLALVAFMTGLSPVHAAGMAYEVALDGVAEKDLRQLLKRTSQLVALQDQPPATRAGLRRRATDDRDRLKRALRSEGFYDASVTIEIAAEAEAEPATVTVRVSSGPVYLLESAEIAYTRSIPDDRPIPRDIADLTELEIGMRARAPRIVAAQNGTLSRLRENGFPEPDVADRRVVVDHDRRTVRVRWRIDPGAEAVFGPLRVKGLERVERDYVAGFQQWKTGAVYDLRKVRQTREALMRTNLFAGIDVEHGPIKDGRQRITFDATEREQRSVGFVARFSTAQGPSASAFWEHRNAFGSDENVRFTVDGGTINQKITGNFSKPRFRQPNQKLKSEVSLRRQASDAFTERAISSTLELDRTFDETWSAALGGSLEGTVTEDNAGERTFLLVGAPGRLTRDTRDSALDPTEGSRVVLHATPYAVTVDETVGFLRSEISASRYWSLSEADSFIMAGRIRVGTILGPPTKDIPASKRFFAGGGGSLRGFDFQQVGPLDATNDPLGGRSVIETSLEGRWRLGSAIGVVPFIDAGNVYDHPVPGKRTGGDARLRVAAGLGFRYYTPIGPVRLDIARALERRDVDDPFELYISFGQAF